MPLYEFFNEKKQKTIYVVRSMVAKNPIEKALRDFHDWTLKVRGYGRVYSCTSRSVYNSWKKSLEKDLIGDFASYESRHGTGSVERDLGMSTEKLKGGVKRYVEKYDSEKAMNTDE